MAAATSLGFAGLHRLLGCAGGQSPPAQSPFAKYGPLLDDPAGVLDLPAGFTYKVISQTGDRMADGFYVPGAGDGMAAFSGPNGRTLLVRNHELSPDTKETGPFGADNQLAKWLEPGQFYDWGRGEEPGLGGTTNLVYDTASGLVEDEYLSLVGTIRNCAGGATPWQSWITCEETVVRAGGKRERDHGYNFEVPAAAGGLVAPVPLKAMGRFNHEAVAVDPGTGIVYQTEDRGDGLLYRFLPDRPGQLAAGGRLQALKVRDKPGLDTRNWKLENGAEVAVGTSMAVEWIDMDEVESPKDDLRQRGFEQGAARFARGEGMWWGEGEIYFVCTNGGSAKKGQVWRLAPGGEGVDRLTLFVEPNDGEIVDNADNLTVTPWGDLVLCEDGGGDQFIVGVTKAGQCYKFAHNAYNESEFAGAVFSPDGSTLFVNIQWPGLTLAISGPWQGDESRRCWVPERKTARFSAWLFFCPRDIGKA